MHAIPGKVSLESRGKAGEWKRLDPCQVCRISTKHLKAPRVSFPWPIFLQISNTSQNDPPDAEKPGHVQANCQRCESTATSSSEATQQCIESFGRTFCDVKICLLLLIPYAPSDCKFTYEFTVKINHWCRYIDIPHMEHMGMFFYQPLKVTKVTAGTQNWWFVDVSSFPIVVFSGSVLVFGGVLDLII